MNIPYLRKLWNYKLVEYQKRKRSSVVFGHPYWLTVDPSNVCNLRCVCCPTGQRRGARTSSIMPLAHFKRIIDRLGPYLLHIDFCNWGEPLLNRDLPEMIAYAKRFGPTTKVDSNLNSGLSEEDAARLVASGLDRLTASIDGASQETYGIYRRDGSFERALSSLALLARKKKELKRATPHLHWQFLVFKHNEHEIEEARRMAHEIGADSIGFTAPFCPKDMVSTIEKYNNYIVKDDRMEYKAAGICEWPWDAITINGDGSVSPCCSVEDQKDDFDHFFTKPFWLIWNGRKYRMARAFIRDRAKPRKDNVCTRCDHIGASNHAPVRPPQE